MLRPAARSGHEGVQLFLGKGIPPTEIQTLLDCGWAKGGERITLCAIEAGSGLSVKTRYFYGLAQKPEI